MAILKKRRRRRRRREERRGGEERRRRRGRKHIQNEDPTPRWVGKKIEDFTGIKYEQGGCRSGFVIDVSKRKTKIVCFCLIYVLNRNPMLRRLTVSCRLGRPKRKSMAAILPKRGRWIQGRIQYVHGFSLDFPWMPMDFPWIFH